MENATKALLIAASILIVIALIGLGIAILSSAQNPAKQSKTTAESMEVSVHNSQFEQYLGSNVSAPRVKELLRRVKQNNKAFINNGGIAEGGIYIILNSGASTYALTTLDEYINTKINAKTYNVQVDYTNAWDDGRIKIINITAN